jgi:hypothetical protein
LLENDSLAESFSSVQKENIELLQKLQKAELELAKYRDKDLSVSDNSQIIIPDKEIAMPKQTVNQVAITED